MNSETPRNWIRLADGRRSGPAVVQPDPAVQAVSVSMEAENAALRGRVRELEEERDILRKAAPYFARDIYKHDRCEPPKNAA